MKYRFPMLFLASAIIFGLSLISIPAHAQTSGIKISPIVFEELVEPGQTFSRQVKVANQSDIGKQFYVYLRDFGAEGETGLPRLLPPGTDGGYTMASWVDITGEAISLGPNEEKVIDYVVRVPSNTGPGGYRGAILFGTEPPRLQLDSEDKGAGMAVAQQAAALILLQVKGDVRESAEIREFNTDKDFYGTPFEVGFVVRIENKGNVHVKPHGAIKIKNMFGREVHLIRVNERGGNILPESTRRFSDINWSGNNAFGKYTATLGLTYGTDVSSGGQGKGSMVAEKTFWIFPWRIIVPIALALFFFGGVLFVMLRVYKNRAIKRAMESAGLGQARYTKRRNAPSPVAHLFMILTASFIVILLIFFIIYILFLT